MPNYFKDNIKKLRVDSDKTLTKVADDLMINRGSYSAYEEGRAKPDLDRIITIAKYFKITIDQLLTTKL